MGVLMSTPTPFSVAREIGTNLNTAFREKKDENAIERILADSMNSEDPKVLQNNIGRILSQVSPERQGQALQYLQGMHSNILKKQDQQQQFQRERQAGLVPGINPTVQSQLLKDKAKDSRLSQYGLGGNSQSKPNFPLQNISQPNNELNPTNQNIASESVFKRLSDDQLIIASGAPDREVSEPAKAELSQRQEERKLKQEKEKGKIKSHTDISQEIIKEAEKEAQTLIPAESALNLMQSAIANKDLSFWSPDNLAELTGIEAFRSPEGALFKTAGKEFFLGSLNRAGARPNQFIERQISEMLPKIGRSTASNLGIARAFQNEIDLKKEKIRLTRDLADDLEKRLGYVPRNIGQLRDEALKVYAETKQKELNNDLRALKAIEEKSVQPFMKVETGTPVSKVVAEALLRQFNGNVKKAEDEAKKLGYSF